MASLRSCGTKPCSQHLVKRSWRQAVTFSPPTGTPPLVYRRFLGTFPGSSDERPSSPPLASASRQVPSSLQLGGSSARRTLPLCVWRWRGCWRAQTSDAWWHPCLSEGLNRLRNRRGAWICCEGPCMDVRASRLIMAQISNTQLIGTKKKQVNKKMYKYSWCV